jgi:hypothetical protein
MALFFLTPLIHSRSLAAIKNLPRNVGEPKKEREKSPTGTKFVLSQPSSKRQMLPIGLRLIWELARILNI